PVPPAFSLRLRGPQQSTLFPYTTLFRSDWLAARGYDEKMGARPLGRVIQEYVKKPLAEEVLFGLLQKGGSVKVTVVGEGSEARLELVSMPPRPARPKAITGPKGGKKPSRKPKPKDAEQNS